MSEKVEWKKKGIVHTDSGRLMITDPAAIVDKLWTDDDYGKFVLRDDSLSVQVPHEKAVLAYMRTDSSSFRISRQLIVAVLDLNNRQLIVAVCDVATVILAYSFLVVIVGRKERKLCGMNSRIASKRFGCG